jgi:hypothetical protein
MQLQLATPLPCSLLTTKQNHAYRAAHCSKTPRMLIMVSIWNQGKYIATPKKKKTKKKKSLDEDLILVYWESIIFGVEGLGCWIEGLNVVVVYFFPVD